MWQQQQEIILLNFETTGVLEFKFARFWELLPGKTNVKFSDLLLPACPPHGATASPDSATWGEWVFKSPCDKALQIHTLSLNLRKQILELRSGPLDTSIHAVTCSPSLSPQPATFQMRRLTLKAAVAEESHIPVGTFDNSAWGAVWVSEVSWVLCAISKDKPGQAICGLVEVKL